MGFFLRLILSFFFWQNFWEFFFFACVCKIWLKLLFCCWEMRQNFHIKIRQKTGEKKKKKKHWSLVSNERRWYQWIFAIFRPWKFWFRDVLFFKQTYFMIFFEKWTQICWIVKYKLSTETSKIPRNLQIIIT